MAVDTVAIKQRNDLLSLVGQDTRLRKVATTAGGEYAGPCPFCGGRDRFRVQPEKGRWWCRRCGDGARWEDAIAYIRKRDGVDFAEACRLLGASESEMGTGALPWRRPPDRLRRAPTQPARIESVSRLATELAEDQVPTPAWQAAGMRFVAEAEAALWSEVGERARAYLHARGLQDETLQTWRIGFQPEENRRDPAECWGFPAQGPRGRPALLRIPRGIVIPWLLDRQLWQLKIRTNRQEPKYLAISGGHPCLYGADTLLAGEAAILPEGEFDALLLWQEVGDLIGVATLGSCNRRLSPGALRYLLACSHVLLPYDADEEGEKGAQRLCQLLPRARRTRTPLGKDVTKFWQLGGCVRDWVKFELTRLGRESPP